MKKLIFLFILFISFNLFAQSLLDYTYYREITLNNPTPVNNFQVKIELTTSNFDYSHCQTSGEDIRFYDSNYTIAFDYWIENWDASGTSIIWVKILNLETSSFSMFYGNASAADNSNGQDTFVYFWDFETGNLNDWDFTGSTNNLQTGSVNMGQWTSTTVSPGLENNYSAYQLTTSNHNQSPWSTIASMRKMLSYGNQPLSMDIDMYINDAGEGEAGSGTAYFLIAFYNSDLTQAYSYGFEKQGITGDTTNVVHDGDNIHYTSNFTSDYFDKYDEDLTSDYYLRFFSIADYAEGSSGATKTETTFDLVKIRKYSETSIIPSVDIEENNPLIVMLTDFYATYTSDNFVSIVWVTQNETNLLGYNIYRSDDDIFEHSSIINCEIIEAQNSSAEMNYEYIDEGVEAERTYYYWLEAIYCDGMTILFGPTSISTTSTEENELYPNKITLQNYPNPFNPTTTFSYNLNTEHTRIQSFFLTGQAENTELIIYNIKGQKIKTFSNLQINNSPNQQIIWNGTDENNQPVSSGIYFYKLNVGNKIVSINKMLLLK